MGSWNRSPYATSYLAQTRQQMNLWKSQDANNLDDESGVDMVEITKIWWKLPMSSPLMEK